MQIYSNNNTAPVAKVLATMNAITAALASADNYASVTVHPRGLNGVTESAVIVAAGMRVTLLHHDALHAWEVLAGDDRYIVRWAEADAITDAVRRVMMP